MKAGKENEAEARKIKASAARREVGEEGEIELLTWGMQYEFTLSRERHVLSSERT